MSYKLFIDIGSTVALAFCVLLLYWAIFRYGRDDE